MSGVTISDLNNILEKIIRDAVEDQLYSGTILWNMFGGYNPKGLTKKQTMPNLNMGVLKTSMDNQNFYIPIMTAHSSGAVAIAEGGTLVAGKPTTAQAEVSAAYETGTFQITKQTLAVKDAGVAVRQFEFFMRENGRAMVLDLQRQCYGDGTGKIGNANGNGSATTTFVFKASPNGDIDYTIYTPPGTQLIIGSNSAVTVSAITGVNTLTLSSALTWSTNDVVKKADGAGTAASEISGLNASIAASGTYETIAYGNTWQPAIYDTTSTTLATADMNKAYLATNKYGDVKYILMNKTEFAAYGATLTGQIRFDYKQVLGGGWTALDYMGGRVKVVLDYDCPDSTIYFISPDYWSLGEMSPFQYEKGTDGYLQRIQGTLNYEVTGNWFGQLMNFKRLANGALTNRVG